MASMTIRREYIMRSRSYCRKLINVSKNPYLICNELTVKKNEGVANIQVQRKTISCPRAACLYFGTRYWDNRNNIS